jgi:hypothetical protein
MNNIANKRLSNRVLWSLEDISALALNAYTAIDWCVERAKIKFADPAMLLRLAEIKGHIVEIRLLSAAARNGEYAGKGQRHGN